MYRILIFMLLLFSSSAGLLYSQVLIVNKDSFVPGEMAIALIYPLPETRDSFELLGPGGSLLECPGMEYNVEGYGKGWLGLIPLAPETQAGTVRVRWQNQTADLQVLPRSFGHLRIPLSEAPEPEAAGDQRLYRQLARFNKDQRYWNGEALRRPVNTYKLLTSPYGEIRTFTRGGRSWQEVHQGIDFADDRGTPCFASSSGRVVISEFLASPGNLVVIEIFPGVYILYYHLDSRAVSRGDQINRGDPVGRIGTTGKSTGPHLHFEVRVHAVYVDPQMFLDGMYAFPTILPEMISSRLVLP